MKLKDKSTKRLEMDLKGLKFANIASIIIYGILFIICIYGILFIKDRAESFKTLIIIPIILSIVFFPLIFRNMKKIKEELKSRE